MFHEKSIYPNFLRVEKDKHNVGSVQTTVQTKICRGPGTAPATTQIHPRNVSNALPRKQCPLHNVKTGTHLEIPTSMHTCFMATTPAHHTKAPKVVDKSTAWLYFFFSHCCT